MNKINHFIEEHTVLSSILLYFVGYLLVGSLIISFTPSKYQIYTRLIISLFLFFFMIRISRKEFDNIIEQINEVLGTRHISLCRLWLPCHSQQPFCR